MKFTAIVMGLLLGSARAYDGYVDATIESEYLFTNGTQAYYTLGE